MPLLKFNVGTELFDQNGRLDSLMIGMKDCFVRSPGCRSSLVHIIIVGRPTKPIRDVLIISFPMEMYSYG